MKYEMDLIDAKDEGVAIGLKNGETIGLKKGRKQGIKEGRKQAISSATKMLISLKLDNETIVHQLMDTYQLSYDEARHYVDQAR
ncbi:MULTISPECIES: hypothetical protein [Limosilactobacillus]|uniref:hypothetical protein n=1 Tax=Limosilactobacillus TaxID=2742598 RepID=UPI002263E555|nr:MULTISPECIES: hypothetical protein [Limosilactobacillus]MCH3922667.1 hypothetical protein [Limosilactobacillus sp.]MCH3927350.1 hypothetical protein [Limosilactobacillus sp.]